MPELRERLQTTLGAGYRVTEELGGGGMSRVFVAEETELGRTVVVKVLPPDLGAGLNVERFRREIQLAARLQHPHIVPLLSGGAKDGLLFYTMPLIEGETLRATLERTGELPVSDAVRILRDVADALSYAHSHGVVHRDIKPENVLVTGKHALVTDFGVSKALASSSGEQDLTSLGVALGTPAYMSPEQATADPHVDHRTDIYALGVLGYELLAGYPPFTGASSQQVLAAQVTERPVPVTKHRPNIPRQLSDVIMRSLEKKPADRWQTADEVLRQLESLATPSGGLQPFVRTGLRETARQHPVLVGIAALVAFGVAGGIVTAVLGALNRGGAGGSVPFVVGNTVQVTNDPGIEITPALSPDGKLIAYAAGNPSETRIYVRQLNGGRPIAVAESVTGDQRAPAWSPDGSQLAFVGAAGVYVVPALGGTARLVVTGPQQTFAATPNTPPSWAGVAWSRDGSSLALADGRGSLFVSRPDGTGQRKIVAGRFPHSPAWSPDGSRVAFVAENPIFIYGRAGWFGNLAPAAIWVAAVSGGDPHRITDATHLNTSPVWTADGRGLLYVSTLRGGRDVYYQRISSGSEPTGDPQRLTTGLNAHSISLSNDGTHLAYSTLASSSTLWWLPVPRSGPVSIGTAQQLTFGNELIETPRLSWDGEWLIFDSDRSGNADIWKVRMTGGPPEQLTHDPADEFAAYWSPDGARIAFHSWRSGSRDLFVMNSDGTGIRQLAATPAHEYGGAWSPDGRSIVFPSDRTGQTQLYVISSEGGPPRRITSSGSNITQAWSPDGRWIAYSRQGEAWVVTPEGTRGHSIATPASLGGNQVTDVGGWSRDSRWVFVRVQTAAGRKDVWKVSIAGEGSQPVVIFDRPDRQPYRDQFTTEGTRLVFTIGKHESDIWVMELNRK